MKRALAVIGLIIIYTQAFSQNPNLQAVLWQQQSAEYSALCVQAFNIATKRLAELPDSGSYFIVTDIDETILDNSPFNAELILRNQEFNKKLWGEWVNKKEAIAVPGALEFLTFADSIGVEVFYISNRRESELDSTIANLSAAGFPNADRKYMLFRKEDKEKEKRRESLYARAENKNKKCALLIGDNLSDFHFFFEVSDGADRTEAVYDLQSKWGTNFIVLPNPMYGHWISKQITYDLGENTTVGQHKINKLKGFKGNSVVTKSRKEMLGKNHYLFGSLGARLNAGNSVYANLDSTRSFESSLSLSFEYSLFFERDNIKSTIDESTGRISHGFGSARNEDVKKDYFVSLGHNINFNSTYLFGGYDLSRRIKGQYHWPVSLVGLTSYGWENDNLLYGLGVSAVMELLEQGAPDSSPEQTFVSLMYLTDFKNSKNDQIGITLILPVNLSQWDGWVRHAKGNKSKTWVTNKLKRDYPILAD